MILTVYIIDDEAHAVHVLKDYVEKTPGLELAGSATNPMSALPDLTGSNPPMLLLLDVDMPGISGLELAGLIRQDTSVIFITSFREFGVEAFELRAVDYLLKPVSYVRFFNAIQKVKDEQNAKHNFVKERTSIFVKGDVKEKYIKIIIKDILFIAAALNYIEINFANEKVLTYLTLGEVLAELPADDFCQVQRSFIVNRNRIKAIEKSQIKMDNDKMIPIGKSFEATFFLWLGADFLISKRLSEN